MNDRSQKLLERESTMIIKRHRDERGPTNIGWLNSMHSFSFGHYYDPKHMGFGPLRVINEDHVVAGAGFDTHPHSNMEIISYVISGELAHKDSMGNGSKIRPGDIQIMSAGSGITHSEYNGSNDENVHFLQIWITPNQDNVKPNYQQRSYDKSKAKNTFHTVIAPKGDGDTLEIRQDVRMSVGLFDKGENYTFTPEKGRKYWLQIVNGHASINGNLAKNGDGFAVRDEDDIVINAETDAEILLFDLP